MYYLFKHGDQNVEQGISQIKLRTLQSVKNIIEKNKQEDEQKLLDEHELGFVQYTDPRDHILRRYEADQSIYGEANQCFYFTLCCMTLWGKEFRRFVEHINAQSQFYSQTSVEKKENSGEFEYQVDTKIVMNQNLGVWEDYDNIELYIPLYSSFNEQIIRNQYDDIAYMDSLLGFHLEKQVDKYSTNWDIRNEKMKEREISIEFINEDKSETIQRQTLATVKFNFIQ